MPYLGFKKLTSRLRRRGARDANALAAWIGRRKHGAAAMAKAAASGRKIG